MFQAFVFDMDGVLLDSERYWVQLPQRLMNAMRVTVPDALRARMGKGWIRPILADMAAQGTWPSPMTLEECVAWCNDEMDTLYREVQAKPGALEMVRWLHAREIPCHVLTATRLESARRALSHAGFSPFLSSIQSAQDLPYPKSDPRCFEKLSLDMGFDPGACVVVEDSLSPITSAKAAGFSTWGLYECRQPDAPEVIMAACDAYFPSFSCIQAHLEAVTAPRRA